MDARQIPDEILNYVIDYIAPGMTVGGFFAILTIMRYPPHPFLPTLNDHLPHVLMDQMIALLAGITLGGGIGGLAGLLDRFDQTPEPRQSLPLENLTDDVESDLLEEDSPEEQPRPSSSIFQRAVTLFGRLLPSVSYDSSSPQPGWNRLGPK